MVIQTKQDVAQGSGMMMSKLIRGINEQVYPTIGSGSGRISSTQVGSLPEDDSFDGAPTNVGISVEKDAILPVKNHVPVSEELITEIDRAIQIDSKFSNLKTTPTDCVPDNSMISSELIEVVVMDENTVILNCDLMGKPGTSIFKGSDIGFKVGCGKVRGNKTTGKGQPKRSGNIDKCVSQSLHSPKRVESVEKSTIGSPKAMMNWKGLVTRPQTLINSPIVDVEPGHKRNQAENMNKEATSVKEEKKHRTVENEQGFLSTMGSMEVAGQPCRA